ncbi:MAG: hypothetical protein AAF348_12855 [Bacteroidota bacterium]
MKHLFSFLLMTILHVQISSAQNFFDRASKHTWNGKGELLGSKASFKMQWEPILDGKFYQLTFQNQRDQSKEFVFKAKGIYQLKENNRIVGTWFDSRGFSFPLKGTISENILTIFWGTPEIEEGKTVYHITKSNTILTNDFILRDGDLQKFGNAIYEPTN